MYYRNFLISYQFIQFEFTLTCLQFVAIHFISLLRINQIFLFIYLFLFSPSCFLNSDHVLSKIFSKIRLKSEITCSRICSFALLIRKPSLTWILPPSPPIVPTYSYSNATHTRLYIQSCTDEKTTMLLISTYYSFQQINHLFWNITEIALNLLLESFLFMSQPLFIVLYGVG